MHSVALQVKYVCSCVRSMISFSLHALQCVCVPCTVFPEFELSLGFHAADAKCRHLANSLPDVS